MTSTKKPVTILTIFGVVFYLAIIVGLNIILTRALVRYIELNQLGIPAQATVIKEHVKNKSGCSVDYSYSAVGSNGQLTNYSGSDGVWCWEMRELEPGGQIEILYVPSNPVNSGMAGYSSIVILTIMILFLDVMSAYIVIRRIVYNEEIHSPFYRL